MGWNVESPANIHKDSCLGKEGQDLRPGGGQLGAGPVASGRSLSLWPCWPHTPSRPHQGVRRINPVTRAEEFYYPPWKRLLFQLLVSLPLCLGCLACVFLLMLACFQLQVRPPSPPALPGPALPGPRAEPQANPASRPLSDPPHTGAGPEREGAAPPGTLPPQGRAGPAGQPVCRGLQEACHMAQRHGYGLPVRGSAGQGGCG